MKMQGLLQVRLFLVGLSLLCTGSTAAQVFPRVSFADPYFLQWYYNRSHPTSPINYSDSAWYLPQMERLGITHSVTKGDNIGLGGISSPVKILNDHK